MDDSLWPTMNDTIEIYPDIHAVLKKICESQNADVETSCKLNSPTYLEKLIRSALLWYMSSEDKDGSDGTSGFPTEAMHYLENLKNTLAMIVVFTTAFLIFLKVLDFTAEGWLWRVKQRRVITASDEGFNSDTTYEGSETELSESSSTETTDYDLEPIQSFKQSQSLRYQYPPSSTPTSTNRGISRQLQFELSQTHNYGHRPSTPISADQQIARQLNFELFQALSYGDQSSSPTNSQASFRHTSIQSHGRQSPPYDSTIKQQHRTTSTSSSSSFYPNSNRVSSSPTPTHRILSHAEEARIIKREEQASSPTYHDRGSSPIDKTDTLLDNSSVAHFSPLKPVGQFLSPPSSFGTLKSSPSVSTQPPALPSFKPGDLVLRPSPDGPHDGPYRMLTLLADGRAELEIPPGSLAGRWYNSSDLIKYSGPLTARAVATWWKQRDGKYMIESIRGERWKKRKKQYRVHWRGWPAEDDTWEFVEGIEEVDKGIVRGWQRGQ